MICLPIEFYHLLIIWLWITYLIIFYLIFLTAEWDNGSRYFTGLLKTLKDIIYIKS